MNDPEMDDAKLNRIIAMTDLRDFLDRTPKGLQTPVLENGRDLPVGIRRRVALARALATDGQLVVLDEPTEGLDENGCQAVYNVLNGLVQDGKTIVVVSRDQKIVKGGSYLLDLSEKPVPSIIKLLASS